MSRKESVKPGMEKAGAGRKRASGRAAAPQAAATLVERILNKTEHNSKMDWREGAAGGRNFPIHQELFDEMGKQAVLLEAAGLEEAGFIQCEWANGRSDLLNIHYDLSSLPEFYRRAGRTPKWAQVKDAERFVRELLEETKSPWIRAYYEDQLGHLENGTIPGFLKPGQESERELVKACFAGLDTLTDPVYKRVFSKQYLKHSKTFKRCMQPKVVSAARRHPMVDENMDDSQVLSQIYIEEYSQELAVKGGLVIELDGNRVDFSAFTYGAALNSETLKHAVIPGGQQIRRVVTVENKANFVSMPYEEGTLILFSHGYFSPKEREFLKKLYLVLEERHEGGAVEYVHTGDLDYGGVMIFRYIRTRIFPKLRPWMMDVETFEAYRKYGETIEESKLEKLKKVEEPLLQPLIGKLCEEGLGIEQESFLFQEQR